jgi:hypothetical protein
MPLTKQDKEIEWMRLDYPIWSAGPSELWVTVDIHLRSAQLGPSKTVRAPELPCSQDAYCRRGWI